MRICLRRREFIAALGGVVTAWPLRARAQRRPIPTIGYLALASGAGAEQVAAFRQDLNEAGYIEGRDVTIQFRSADQTAQLPELAANLVRSHVAVIVAMDGFA